MNAIFVSIILIVIILNVILVFSKYLLFALYASLFNYHHQFYQHLFIITCLSASFLSSDDDVNKSPSIIYLSFVHNGFSSQIDLINVTSNYLLLTVLCISLLI